MPSSSDTTLRIGQVGRIYPDLTQIYFNEGLHLATHDHTPQQSWSHNQTLNHTINNTDNHTLIRPDYPLYPEIAELNIPPTEAHEIAPDYPLDSSKEEYLPSRYNTNRSSNCSYVRNQLNININKPETKVLNDKAVIEAVPSDQDEFDTWMSWRTQVNRQLAATILIKDGRRVVLRPSELWRKPLSPSTIRSVIDNANSICRWSSSKLPGKPYIMYGIPRVNLFN